MSTRQKTTVIVILFAALVCGYAFSLFRTSFSRQLRRLLVEKYGEECAVSGPLTVLENIESLPVKMVKRNVTLKKSVYRYEVFDFEQVDHVDQVVTLNVPEGSGEKESASMYSFTWQDIRFHIEVLRQMRFSAQTSPILYKPMLEKEGISYQVDWFKDLQSRLSSLTDEALLCQSLAINYKDIKKAGNIDALYNGALMIARMVDIGYCEEPHVIYEGEKSLYLFPYHSGPKLSVTWILFAEKEQVASGMLSYKYADEPEEKRIIKAASYLKSILLSGESTENCIEDAMILPGFETGV